MPYAPYQVTLKNDRGHTVDRSTDFEAMLGMNVVQICFQG